MAIDYVRNIISSGYNLSKINDNFVKIQEALQDGLSRSGNGPNQMSADLDLNDNDILNVNTINAKNISIDGGNLQQFVDEAREARDFAYQWSSSPSSENVNDGVNPVGKSSYHWAQVALGASTGVFPDGSITTNKLEDGAVTLPKIASGVLEANNITFKDFRNVEDKLKDYVFLEDYGGGTDKTASENVTAFNNARDELISITGKGGLILMRGGVYEINSPLVLLSGVTLEGQGADNTIIRPTYTNDDVIKIGNGVDVVQHANVRNFSIEPASTMTTGSLIRFQNHFFCIAENIRMPTNVHWGVAIDKGAVSYIAKIKDVFVNGGEFGLVIGNQGVGDVQNVDVVGCQFGQQTGAGIALFNVGGIFIDTTECLMCNVGLFTYPDASSRVLGLRMGSRVYLDSCITAALQIYSNGGKVIESQFNGTWFSSTSSSLGVGVDINSSAGPDKIRNVNFVNTTSTNNRGAGFRIANCQDIHLTGVDAVANGMEYFYDSLTRAPGIQILSGATDINIVGGRSGKSGNFDFNHQDYGVTVSSGASGVNICGVDVRDNFFGGVVDFGTGTTISSCPGCKTHAHGTFLFPSGASSYTINHGMAFQPTYGDISVTVAGILSSSGITGIYVTGTTSTTITFSANTTLTSPINVVWFSRVKE